VENTPSISANAFDHFRSTILTRYDVPSKESHEARVSLNSSGLTPTTGSTAVSPASGVWLRRALLAIAAFETLLGLEEFSEAFDLHAAPLSFGQFVINARLFIHPFLAIAGLVLAARHYLRAAIIVLAAYILVAWLADLPTMARFGIEWDWSTLGLSLLAQQVIFAPLAVTAIVLASLDRLLWLCAIFVALPPANLLLGMILFTIGIMIYGF
jgi:hypothetical protein